MVDRDGRVGMEQAGKSRGIVMRKPPTNSKPRHRRYGCAAFRWHERRAVSLLELLIVIGIIALLLQLMLPAIHAARQSTRRLICARKLQTLGNAMSVHHDARGHFPSGGWHYTWVGEPERGTGADQPGSWAFNLLEYLDLGTLRNMGAGVESPEDRADAIKLRCRTPLSEFVCPRATCGRRVSADVESAAVFTIRSVAVHFGIGGQDGLRCQRWRQ